MLFKMSKLALFNAYLNERLNAAAVEIVGAVERTIIEYQEELSRSKEENDRLRVLLDFNFKTQIPSHGTDTQHIFPERQQYEQKMGQEDFTQIKNEEEELLTNRGENMLEGLDSDTNDSIVTFCQESKCKQPYAALQTESSRRMSKSSDGNVLCITIPNEIKTDPDGECYTVSEETSASQSLLEGYPGYSAAPSENSGSDNEVECEGTLLVTKPLKSTRNFPKSRLNSHTHAGGSVTTNADFPFCCKLCGSTFVHMGLLVKHVKKLHTKPTAEYRCGVCEEVFESIENLTDHLQTHINATCTCNVCGRCFPSDSSMRTHMVCHTGEKQYQCKKCGKSFKNKGNMHLHMRCHTGEKTFWCLKCDESFTCKGYLKEHMKFHTSEEPEPTNKLATSQEEQHLAETESATKDTVFTICEKSVWDPVEFSTQTSKSGKGDVPHGLIPEVIKTEPDGECYTVSEETSASQSLSERCPGYSAAQSENSGSDSDVEHERTPSETRYRGIENTNVPYVCKLCGSTFVYMGPLVNHVKNVHTKHTKMCGVCEQVFESIASLTDHLQTHIKATRTCNFCGKCFPSEANLRIHTVSHTGEKRHQCKECGKCFKTKAYMKLHMRLHTGEKPFQCKECGESFTCNGYLKVHMKFHTGQKSYRCKDCGDDFNQKEQLEQHMWTHRGEKPHGCQHCPKSFKRKDELTRHMAVHTGVRPFKCTICGHCFATTGNLTQHLSTHTGEKPYQCIFCSRRFRNNPLLKSHLKNRHEMP